MSDQSLGVYLHVPFCERVCPYCDFAVVAERRLSPEREDRYVDALLLELEARRPDFAAAAPDFAAAAPDTLYFGGGTPSLLRPESIRRLVAAVCGGAAPSGLEITLEVNPSTLERERLPGFREAGVNRLSVGVQSFDDRVLKRLGRAHRADEARRTLDAARRAGFDNVSVDLVWAAPGQDLAALDRDLDELVARAPEHVSAYCLTIEEGTPFALAERRGQLARADDESQAEMMQRVSDRLAAAGLLAYEISSFARPGRESRHNRRYWERRPVLGLGVGAWSSEPPGPEAPFGARRANERSLPAWQTRIEARGPPPPAERLDEPTARGEAVFLALRTARGLDASLFQSEFGAPPRSIYGRDIEELVSGGLLHESASGDLRLTRRGWLLADAISSRFV